MNIAETQNKIIAQLNIKDEEKLMIKEIAEDLPRKIEEETSIGHPREIYEAARFLLGRGKLLRGNLAMFINGVYGFYKKEKALRLATAIELLHTASLIHDDIIDRGKMRRSVKTVHEKFGLNIAIISADLLVSIAYRICADMGKQIIEMVSDAIRRMSEAEVLENIIDNPNLDDYFKIIEGKSSVLFSTACACSAIISNAGKEDVLAFKKYGELLGKILQIRDDVLDYVSNETVTGKSNPLIYGLKRTNIVVILMNEKNLTLDEAIISATELGKELADKASREVTFLEPDKRNIFKEFVKFVLNRKF